MAGVVRAPDINAVLDLVTKLSVDGDTQITLLIYALAAAVQGTDANSVLVLEELAKTLSTPIDLVPLEEATATRLHQKLN